MKKLISFVFVYILITQSWVVASAQSADSLYVDFYAAGVCYPDATTLISLSEAFGDSIQYQVWDMNGDGRFDDASGDTVSWHFNPGAHDVGLKVMTWNGLTRAIYKIVTAGQLEADFAYEIGCVDQFMRFFDKSIVTGDEIIDYTWDFGDGSTPSHGKNPRHQYISVGSYDVKMVVVSQAGCRDSLTRTVTIGELKADFIFSGGCINSNIQFTDNSTVSGGSITSYTWDFGDGTAVSHLKDPIHQYNTTGSYDVKLVVYAQSGCKDSITYNVNAGELIAEFLPENGCLNQKLYFQNKSVVTNDVITDYTWSFGDGSSGSHEKDPLHAYSTAGTFNVELVVSTQGGCIESISHTVTVGDDVYAPEIMTLFTPNGDGMNDRWQILNLGLVGPCEVSIYNRTGDLVFSNSVYANEWDGTFNGKLLANDTYYYFVRCFAQCTDNTIQGTVNILK